MTEFDLSYGLNKVELPLIITSERPNLCFLIDTGATHNLLFSYVIKAVERCLTYTGEIVRISGIEAVEQDTQKVSMPLKFGNREVNVEFNLIDAIQAVLGVQQETGIQLHGILGVPFLYEYKCVIDFNKHLLKLQ